MVLHVGTSILVALVAALTACYGGPATTTSSDTSEATGLFYATADEQQIEIVNPSRNAIRLLDWAFSRFLEARLGEPRIDRIHFGDQAPDCASRSGWAKETAGGVEIAICLADASICRNGAGSALTNSSKLCALHELAHGWLFEHAHPEIKSAFLDHAGLDAWTTTDETPWHERGAEYAAEVVAWGLMDAFLDLIRIDSPECAHLEAGFRILTEAAPLVRCDLDG